MLDVDLAVIVDITMGAGLGSIGGIAITPDGSSVYVERDTTSVNSQQRSYSQHILCTHPRQFFMNKFFSKKNTKGPLLRAF